MMDSRIDPGQYYRDLAAPGCDAQLPVFAYVGRGLKGDQGDKGDKGDKGDPGEDAIGVPVGGEVGEILMKSGQEDGATAWVKPFKVIPLNMVDYTTAEENFTFTNTVQEVEGYEFVGVVGYSTYPSYVVMNSLMCKTNPGSENELFFQFHNLNAGNPVRVRATVQGLYAASGLVEL